MDDDEEPCPGYAEWETWWLALTPAEREAEIKLMDEHVASSQLDRRCTN